MRILVLGHGLIGKRRARAIENIEGATLVGTIDQAPRPDDLYGGVPHFSHLEDIPMDGFDAAVIALPHHLGHAYAVRCLFAQKPVLIEKPLGRNSTEAYRVVRAARNTPLPSFVGYNYRFLPHVRRALELCPTFGKLRSIELTLGHGGHPGSAKGWKLDPKLAGGGVLIDPGVHLFDLLLQASPEIGLVHVSATRGFWKTGIEEDATAVFESSTTIATVRVSHVRWVNTFRLEIFGEEGYAICDGRGGHYGEMTLRTGTRWGWQSSSSQAASEALTSFGLEDASFEDEMRAVVSRWSGGTSELEPASLERGLRVAEIVDDMYGRLEAIT